MKKFNVFKDNLTLSHILKEKAVRLYLEIIEENIKKNKPIDVMVAATIYVTCRSSETSHTLSDIVKATGLKKKSIAKYYRYILTNLDLQIPAFDIEQCVLRISKDMKISEKMKQHAIIILDSTKEKYHQEGKKPMAIAAAAIYLASIKIGEKISQQELAKTAMVSDVSIRKRCKELVNKLGGRIGVESKQDIGTSFYFSIPKEIP